MTDNTTPPEGGSGFFGKLRDVLFEPEPAAAAPAAADKSTATATAPAPGPSAAAAVAAAKAKNPMVERMMEVVMEKTTAYTALVEAITPLEAFIPDEASRYKAAFGIVGKTRTLDQIVQSIDMQHLPALEAESQRFHGQAKHQQDLQINARMREMDSLRASVAKVDEERARLQERLGQIQQEVEAAHKRIAGFEGEIAAKRAEIVEVNIRFESALAVVKAQLVEARAKVVRYLGA
jgi:chromosome segregation ATPase